jgi:cyclopropane fatty-acyl-phospholipid synthase-like methyltransferase
MLKAIGQQLEDGRWLAAPAERNRDAILAELKRVLPNSGLVLEIASGTGQHVIHFANALPRLTWQPSDADAAFRRSVEAWIAKETPANVRAPVDLDVLRQPWPIARADAVLCINMIHVSPWAATQALLDGAKAVLPRDGVLFLYGPYRRFGRHTAASNEAFDMQLQASNPEWGLRDLETVLEVAKEAGFSSVGVVDMPANNFSVVLRAL